MGCASVDAGDGGASGGGAALAGGSGAMPSAGTGAQPGGGAAATGAGAMDFGNGSTGGVAGGTGALPAGSGALQGGGGMAGGVCGAAGGAAPAAAETCGNGLDDDHNGFVDEFCPCTLGQTQTCFGGRPDLLNEDTCSMGTQLCDGTVEFTGWGPCEGWTCGTPVEVCDGSADEDCDGEIDEGCQLDVPVDIDGDCVTAACPAQAPYPVGCEIEMQGDDPRGCVANTPGQSEVYFQEGDACGAGRVVGRLLCSTQMPATPLDAGSCSINKAEPTFGQTRNDCAPTGCVEILPGVCI